MVIKMKNKYAIIQNNKVVNIVVANSEFAFTQGWIECPANVDIGWDYNGETLNPPIRNVETEWNEIRINRDNLLLESDTNVLPDRWAAMTLEKQTEWSVYRQILRDIPQSFLDPKDVIWPTKPE